MAVTARARAALALFLASGMGTGARACSPALVESLAVPRLVTTADAYEVTMRRRIASTDRADQLLLKEALRKSLGKDATQAMVLRGVTFSPVSQCEGYRIVGLSVKRENVSFVAAPPPPLPAPAQAAEQPAPKIAAPAPPAPTTQTPAAMPPVAPAPAQAAPQASPQPVVEESTERLVELWQARQATTAQLRTLQLRMNLEGERVLVRQLVDDIAASMRQRDLPAISLTPRELTLPATRQQPERSLD